MLACAAGVVFPTLSLLAQDQEPDGFVIRSDVRLVLLDVSVKDRAGRPVSGLKRDQFRVFEDGKPQTVTEFANSDIPVTVGLVIDESFSMRPKRDDVLAAAFTFIGESNPLDETFVVNFNDTVKLGLPTGTPFSGNGQELQAALFRGVPEGRTALNDAVIVGLKHLGLGRRAKKTLVVISDGGDNASVHTRRQLIDMVERTPATIYTIGLYTGEDPDRDPGLLTRLAHMSGGDVYLPEKPTEMLAICRRIAKDIRARYTIGYIPARGSGKADLRHIRVKVSAPGHGALTARTRTSYRYDVNPATRGGG